uniref:Uncharacterized protein n=1 Tax=Lotharella oceanica TaxID=641309 RepID=A0A7S2X7H8_9EUKA
MAAGARAGSGAGAELAAAGEALARARLEVKRMETKATDATRGTTSVMDDLENLEAALRAQAEAQKHAERSGAAGEAAEVAVKAKRTRKRTRKPKSTEARDHNLRAVMAMYDGGRQPLQESVDLVESMLRERIRELVQRVLEECGGRRMRVQEHHILYVVRKSKHLAVLQKRANSYRRTINALKESRSRIH